jgi:ABC-type multidrug transport system fused ATPase/permease subunit
MKALKSVQESLSLLAPRDRSLLLLIVILQSTLSALDVVAIGLIGIVAAMATGTVTGRLANVLESVQHKVGLGNVGSTSIAIGLGAVAGVLLVSKSAVSFLVTRRIFTFLARRQAIISSSLAERLLKRPLLEVQQRSSQTVGYALTWGVNAITVGVIGQATIFVSEASLLLILAVALFFVDPVVTLFTIVFFTFVVLVMHRAIAGWASRLGRESADTQVQSYQAVEELLSTYREVVVSGRRSLFVARFRELRWHAGRVQSDLAVVGTVSKYVFETAVVVGGGLLAVSQALSSDAKSAVAVIALFLAAASRIMPSLLRIQTAALTIRSSTGVAQPTLDLANDLAKADLLGVVAVEDVGVDDRVMRGIAEGHRGFVPSVLLERVDLTYPGASEAAIDGVSLAVPAGTSLALVGSTGAGKSTLADLILGLVEPDAGTALLSGRPPGDAIREWPGAVAYVPQTIALVNSDVRGNVALGLSTDQVKDERVWEALERAQLADFLRAQREGLDTVVGEHGVRLSGGQRQRLGIARALFTRPRLLVLDEATSALDADTELAISRSLSSLAGDVTLIVIAHRLTTVRNADQIVHLDRGRVSAIGTYDELRIAVPAFNRQASLLGL